MPVLLMEPASQTKRRHLSETLRTPERQPGLTLEDVLQRLQEIRSHSLAHLDIAVAELATGPWSGMGVDVTLALDTKEAIDTILRISGNTEIAVNRSSVVANELLPGLTASGRDVTLSYPQEFAAFESDPFEYWQLPRMMLESRFRSFETLVDLSASRTTSIERHGAQNLTALLGVNAISVDGTILMLQHMQNIRKVFEQAKDIIFVAGIDKIVRSADDAIFQTQCMAVFGSEVLPLSFGAKRNLSGGEERPSQTSFDASAGGIHLILLDNGRSQIMRSPYRELLACIDCRACAKGCPGSRFFREDATWSPKEYLYFYLLGKNRSLDRCLQCKTCQGNCPLRIEIPGMITGAKVGLLKTRRPPLADMVLSRGGAMEKWGSRVAPLANLMFRTRALRRLGDAALGISYQRRLPPMSRQSFARWYVSRSTKD
jgi:L-lactate dehydrogenase complex protein LldF